MLVFQPKNQLAKEWEEANPYQRRRNWTKETTFHLAWWTSVCKRKYPRWTCHEQDLKILVVCFGSCQILCTLHPRLIHMVCQSSKTLANKALNALVNLVGVLETLPWVCSSQVDNNVKTQTIGVSVTGKSQDFDLDYEVPDPCLGEMAALYSIVSCQLVGHGLLSQPLLKAEIEHHDLLSTSLYYNRVKDGEKVLRYGCLILCRAPPHHLPLQPRGLTRSRYWLWTSGQTSALHLAA